MNECCELVPLMKMTPPNKFRQIWREQSITCAMLSAKFSLRSHSHAFHILCMNIRIVWINKIFIVDDDGMSVNAMANFINMSVCSPSI